jgi:hypothetical protein
VCKEVSQTMDQLPEDLLGMRRIEIEVEVMIPTI